MFNNKLEEGLADDGERNDDIPYTVQAIHSFGVTHCICIKMVLS